MLKETCTFVKRDISNRQLSEEVISQGCNFDGVVAHVRQTCQERHLYMQRDVERYVKRDVCI